MKPINKALNKIVNIEGVEMKVNKSSKHIAQQLGQELDEFVDASGHVSKYDPEAQAYERLKSEDGKKFQQKLSEMFRNLD